MYRGWFMVIVLFPVIVNCFVSPGLPTCRKKNITALILARSGSKGIQLKNIALINNVTLLGRTIRLAYKIHKFDSIWVSTDGKKIAEVAELEGARVHIRDPYTATDTASSISAAQEFLMHHPGIDILALLQCTSPWIKPKYLAEAIDVMLRGNADCVFSASRSFKLRWNQKEGGFATPLNFDPNKRPRRQDWRGELIENGMFYFSKTDLVRRGMFQNNRCLVVEVPQELSLEIDTEEQLRVVRLLAEIYDN